MSDAIQSQPNIQPTELLARLEASAARQEAYAKKQCSLARFTALACGGLLAVALVCAALLIPRAIALLDEADAAMADLTVISSELADTDIGGMVDNVDHLVTEAQTRLADAADQINDIDIQTLNKAIKDLSDVIAPLANLFGR